MWGREPSIAAQVFTDKMKLFKNTMFKLTLINKKQETSNTTSFIFKSEQPLGWQAGQFLHYKLQHPTPDERKEDRWFTISSAPHEGRVMLTTRVINHVRGREGSQRASASNGVDKPSSFKAALNNLPLGGTIEAEGPDGEFVVDDPNKDHIFIAGGVGVTPYRAILLDLERRGLPINVALFYTNGNQEFVYKDELEAVAKRNPGFKILYFVSPEKIDGAVIKKYVPDLQKPAFYVSGPEPMVVEFEKMLMDMGIPDEHIKRDYFSGYDWK